MTAPVRGKLVPPDVPIPRPPMFWCAWCGDQIHTVKGLVVCQGVTYCCDPCYHDARAADIDDRSEPTYEAESGLTEWNGDR